MRQFQRPLISDVMDTRILDWNWWGKTIRIGADASGNGPKVLLLPALSSISTRREMRPLQERLAARYSTLAVDWPGFGEAPRPQNVVNLMEALRQSLAAEAKLAPAKTPSAPAASKPRSARGPAPGGRSRRSS